MTAKLQASKETMSNLNLALSLARAETEDEVVDILTEAGYWNDQLSWQDFGGSENNFATVGNQQSKPEVALVEKLVNSVDAVLMAECIAKGYDLDGPGAPQSIKQAVEWFFGVEDGKLSNMSAGQRSALAERICLVATGSKQNPCYSVIDLGEGQTPRSMPDTLLSIGKSNKLRIPFVQGKFNMGGTGVLQFCGTRNLQLLISKRHPKVAETDRDSTKRLWGVSIVRRENPSKGIRSSIYRYLAPEKEILSFDVEELRLFPSAYPDAYSVPLKWGTFIKLYEYQMTGLKTNILFDLYNRLSLLMAEVALPIRLYERRQGYTGHSMETTLAGLTVRLDDDSRGNLEADFPTSAVIHVNGQTMRVSIFAFMRNQAEKYRKDEGVIFLINGQTHGRLTTTFFSKKAVGMGYLADSILVMVDCTDIEGRAREDLFMNSRDRLRSGAFRDSIERELEELLRNHPGLRELRERRRREDLQSQVSESGPLEDIIESVLRKLPSLARLLQHGFRISNPFATDVISQKTRFNPNRYPTFFRLSEAYPVEHPKHCPINNERFRIQYFTDADNEYFNRSDYPGQFKLFLGDSEVLDFVVNLWNGIGNLNVNLPSNIEPGALLKFRSEVIDPTRVEPFTEEFVVLIERPAVKRSGVPGNRKSVSTNPGRNGHRRQGLEIPRPHLVYREKWADHKFNEQSAIKVVDNGSGGYDYFVNADNVYLAAEKKSLVGTDPRTLEVKFAVGMAIIGLAVLREADENHSEGEEIEPETVTEQVSRVGRLIAPFLIPMLQALTDFNVEEMAVAYDQE